MKRASLGGLLGIVLVTSLVRADAPQGQYALFDSQDTEITDNFTKLTWSRTYSSDVTFLGAQTACGAKRVPTLKELLTLVDESPHLEFEGGKNVPKMIDQNAFRGTPTDKPFWTITPAAKAGMTTSAFVVDFGTGATAKLDANAAGGKTAYVRCVK